VRPVKSGTVASIPVIACSAALSAIVDPVPREGGRYMWVC
jgi:hypothetical protein